MSSRSCSAGPGEGRGDARPQLALEHRQHRVPHPGAGEARVVVVGVGPPLDAVGAGRPPRSASRLRSRNGRANTDHRPRTYAASPGSERPPEPRARPSSTVSAWSSRVCPSSTTERPKCSASCASTSYRASRAAASMPAGPGSTVTRTDAVSSAPSAGHLGHHPGGVLPEPSWSPWSTTAPTTRTPALRPSKTQAASSASESAPPEQATRTPSPQSASEARAVRRAGSPRGRDRAPSQGSAVDAGDPERRVEDLLLGRAGSPGRPRRR